MSDVIDITLTAAYTAKVDTLRDIILHLPEERASKTVKLLALITDDLKLLTALHDVIVKGEVAL